DTEWGSVSQSGNGVYGAEASVTITALPAEGYRFVNWTRAGLSAVFSTEAVYTFAVTEDLALVAVFEKIPDVPVPPVEETFTVQVSANNTEWGLVSQSGNGTYKKDSLATITALPFTGYRFVNWTKADGSVFGLASDTTFAVTENLVLVAVFEEIPDVPVPPVEEDFTVQLSVNNPAWGRVLKTGNCIYEQGEEITILALPFAGYRFVNWTEEDGSVFATDSLLTFKVTENLELTAHFEKIPDVPVVPVVDTFTVQVSANDAAWGSVAQSGNGRYEKDSSASITATANPGYRFVNWSKDAEVYATAAETPLKVRQ
ncbi:MAG: InlB B-repeat-containing protein, partial [Bacteroidales bacterium]|nr:InlB B-repeat-containing protein [Bacteroidales bacterium]